MKHACLLLSIVGAIIGLVCGLLFPVWVMATVEILCILIAAFGVYQTWFKYGNRHEFTRWCWLCGSLIGALPIGYLLGLVRLLLV